MSTVLRLDSQLRLVGVVLVLLGLAHLGMPRVLGWRREFTALVPLTRQIMYAHTYFIGLTCVLLGLAPLALTRELLAPGQLSTCLLGAECLFWGLRWGAQFVAFPPSVWRRSPVLVCGYAGLTVLWTWIVLVFAAALAAR